LPLRLASALLPALPLPHVPAGFWGGVAPASGPGVVQERSLSKMSQNANFDYLFEGIDVGPVALPEGTSTVVSATSGDDEAGGRKRRPCRWLQAMQTRKTEEFELMDPSQPSPRGETITGRAVGPSPDGGTRGSVSSPTIASASHSPAPTPPMLGQAPLATSRALGYRLRATPTTPTVASVGTGVDVSDAVSTAASIAVGSAAFAAKARSTAERQVAPFEARFHQPSPSERRLNPEDGRVYQYSFYSRRFAGQYSQVDIDTFWHDSCEPCVCVPGRRRVLVLRHGSRPDHCADPPLDPLGHTQAALVAEYLAKKLCGQVGTASHIAAIFCSPFTRALQTAEPVAKALDLPIFVEWGFSELLAHNWLHSEDPLPELHARSEHSLPGHKFIDRTYSTAVMPEYPDVTGLLRPGDDARRSKPLQRHGSAAEVALQKAKGASILIIGHGSTHDFVMGALCPQLHPTSLHTPACVPNCGITEIVEDAEGDWRPVCFGSTPWKAPGCESE